MPEPVQKKAIWTPSWYEMDQSIAVAMTGKFLFFQNTSSGDSYDDDVDFVFFNQLDSDTNSELRFATVAEIYHKNLGPLKKVDTDGLDYIFSPIDGDDVLVNAEEEPGKTYDDELEIDDWSVEVLLVDVSSPTAGDIV